MNLSESSLVWLHFKEVFAGVKTSYRRKHTMQIPENASADELPFGPHRDPVTSASAMSQLLQQYGWQTPLAQASVVNAWAELVGEQTARHTNPQFVDDAGVLQVQCDSTAWATQLRSIRGTVLGTINQRFPDAEIRDIKFLNPGAPSWRHGIRSVPGRGPRDTYG
ncbi:DUF721 domain-containing protein [Gulosibacter bifidus]|uniref:DUF721 domain-containing protein n=1 Tax=Gulosibacter bifidus TaxID=272239 RepID=A0ABW5RKH7_9MICO|nr:DciA family protein [Gulosibacter bifidus]